MSKKLARLQTDWTPKPRGRRRARRHIRKAADRAMILFSVALASALVILIVHKHFF